MPTTGLCRHQQKLRVGLKMSGLHEPSLSLSQDSRKEEQEDKFAEDQEEDDQADKMDV